ncbi:MAG: hypothetical protein M0Z54_00710 [Thermaerobacter sp.]|nr:hypothetical protein [Thermaerobacter sp.]
MTWPTFVTTRDRVRDLRHLVPWLERVGADPITLVDCGSTWPPLLEFLADTPHAVVRLPNLGPRAVWLADLAPADRPYVVTDPDLVPGAFCPEDVLAHLADLLARYPGWPKAGLGLDLQDLPRHSPIRPWEESLPARPLAPGVYASLIDTTLALYRPGGSWTATALRTGAPYVLRHPSWAVETPDAEDAYYLTHARPGPDGSSWAAAVRG